MLAPQKESIFGCSCRLWLLSWRRARVFARSCSLLSKYLPISWKQRKEQSHAQCHVTHRIRIFDKISEHVKVAKSVDIAVPELAVTVQLTQKSHLLLHLFSGSFLRFSGFDGTTLGYWLVSASEYLLSLLFGLLCGLGGGSFCVVCASFSISTTC